MALSEPQLACLLVVERNQSLREALLSLLAQEGYAANGVSSLEEALREVEKQPYALILADLFAGVSRHSFTPAHILRRRAMPIPMGLITDQASALEQPQPDGFAFVVPRIIEAPLLLAEIAAALNGPFSAPQQRQARVLERFLAAWGTQEWKSLLRLCTEGVVCYPSSLFPSPSARPLQVKLALLPLVAAFRRHYHSFRIEAPEIYPRPHGLAVRYSGCFAEFGSSWEFFGGVELFQFAGERISQIGLDTNHQQWCSLIEVPSAFFGPSLSS
jgi:CheY-like chemotaxis protein